MKTVYKWLLKLSLRLDNWLYTVNSRLAIRYFSYHPKHDILQYQQWFSSKLQENDVVVDIGSNTGSMVRKMAPKCKYVYGLEIEKNLHDKAMLNVPENVKFEHVDATKFDYESVNASVITLSNVLEHIDDRTAFLSKITSMSNARIYIRVPMIERDWRVLLKKDLGIDYRLDPTHFTEYTQTELVNEIMASGLSILELNVRFGEFYLECIKK